MTADQIFAAINKAKPSERENLLDVLMQSYAEPDREIIEGLAEEMIAGLADEVIVY